MLKLNLGCGPHALEGWVNYDLEESNYVSKLDLSRGHLPHKTNSADYIFSEHFIEHITREQFIDLARECFRVLKPNGVFRVSTPDLGILVSNYCDWLRGGCVSIPLPAVWNPQSPCQMVNQGMRLWGHQYLYDLSELNALLLAVGFSRVHTERWRDSCRAELRDLECRPYHGDLILEAFKEEKRDDHSGARKPEDEPSWV